jgi:hypothetical protein
MNNYRPLLKRNVTPTSRPSHERGKPELIQEIVIDRDPGPTGSATDRGGTPRHDQREHRVTE